MTRLVCAGLAGWLSFAAAPVSAADGPDAFQTKVKPILEEHCFECHAGGSDKGGVSFDGALAPERLRDAKLWDRVLRNTRTGLMPPKGDDPLSAAERETLARWIKREAIGIDPARPDPGRVTVRRLNRVEYRNTVRALLGVEYDTQKEFPADDTGHGFDNIADVLTLSPMLLEKYLDAAQAIVAQAVPTTARAVAEEIILGRALVTRKADTTSPDPAFKRPPPSPPPEGQGPGLDLSYYTPAIVAAPFRVRHAGPYRIGLDMRPVERFVDASDGNKCRLMVKLDGETLLERELVRNVDTTIELGFDRTLAAGAHEVTFEMTPVEPAQPQLRNLRLRVNAVTIRGPLDERHYVEPAGYRAIFPRPVPADPAERRRYARALVGSFATRAFRRPVDKDTTDRLVAIAERVWSQPKATFEAGVAQAMVAVLASPRFIFREEATLPVRRGQAHPFIDEWALASRLSYFFWSSMPDAQLTRLARRGQLRARIDAQIDRMLADPRSDEFVRNFAGQWLQSRDVGDVPINADDVFLRDHPNPEVEEARATFRRLRTIPDEKRTPAQEQAMRKARETFRAFFRQPRPQFADSLRKAMREETERTFEHVLRADRSVLELIESDWTFLNEELAKHYGIDGVTGPELRKVTLPAGSARGGVLTQGTVLVVTSNPTRTSPVKRGVFILDAILGSPPPPPPPNIPALEDVAPAAALRKMSLRETMALHATNKTCASCHMRMDPLGLALETFNAMGAERQLDAGQPILAAGKLATGETFADARELKHVLATARRRDVFYCLAEKVLTYALGRGIEPSDAETVDQLVSALERNGGRLRALLRAVVASPQFQQRRVDTTGVALGTERGAP